MNNTFTKQYRAQLQRSQLSQGYQKNYVLYNNYFKKNFLHLLHHKNCKILELGCGFGNLLYSLKINGYKNITGIDIVKDNVEICVDNKLPAQEDDMFRFVKKTDETFDVVILNNVLEHYSLLKIEKFMTDITNCLSEHGRIIFIVPNCNNIHGLSSYYSDLTHQTGFTEKSLNQLADKLGMGSRFFNLYPLPNLPIIDSILYAINFIRYHSRPILHILNGQVPFHVNSKHILAEFSL